MGCIVETYYLLNLLDIGCAFEQWLYGAQAQGRLGKWGRMGEPLSGQVLVFKQALFHATALTLKAPAVMQTPRAPK
jgi:hypothetical protein